ncbi:MAG: SH3 domain-containing protein [Usitatibacteraceae bacterium]
MPYRNAATLWAAFCLVPSLAIAQTPAAPSAATAPSAPAPLFAAIGDKPAILYDGLSTKATKIFILSRNHPVEILVKLDKWTKVRDAENTVGWMENAFVGDKRFVQVIGASAEIRLAPNANATIAFEAQRGVLLEPTGAATIDGWLPVRHREGQTGFVRVSQVWGA